jgi:hypothetical protein
MSFGLRNAAQTFQRFMDDNLRRLDFCFAYLDDILLFSHSLEEHEQHMRTLFNQLQRYGILINSSKCVFRASVVTFLGYRVSVHEDRVAHLQDCPLLRPPVNSAASWAC